MKRIAIVVEHYYPLVSGVPVVMQYLAEGLALAGYAVSVHTGGYIQGKRLIQEEEINGVSVKRYFIRSSPLYFVHGERNEKSRFISDIQDGEFDCVILTCSQCWSTNLLLPHLGTISAKKIFYPHGYSGLKFTTGLKEKLPLKSIIGKFYRYWWMKVYYARMPRRLKQFDRIVYISANDSAKQFGDHYGITNYSIIDNATEDCFFVKDPPQNTDDPYFTCVANYTAVKNQEDLLQAFYMAKTENYGLILVGREKNDYYKRLEMLRSEYEKRYGKKPVSILYGIPRSKIHDIVSAASGYIMSSKWEEYSISLCEAMAEQVPFISTDVGNARFLPGGIIVNSIDEMSRAITKLISDKRYATDLGKEGYRYAKEHNSRSGAVKRLVNVIEEIT